MSEGRVIKRYSNRKLYDLKESRYVTLQEVAEFLQAGDEVQILDNKTGEDITSVTLAQILYEQEKLNRSNLPLSTLKGIVRSSGEILHKKLANVTALADEAEKKMASFKEQAERKVEKMGEDARSVVVGVSQATQSALDELTKAVDDRFKQLIGFPILGASQKEVEPTTISDRLVGLEKRIKELEARIAELEKK